MGLEILVLKESIAPINSVLKVGETAKNQVLKWLRLVRMFWNNLEASIMFKRRVGVNNFSDFNMVKNEKFRESPKLYK